MNRLAELRARRAKITKEMRAIADAPAGDDGDLTADQTAQFETRKKELAAAEASIAREEGLQDAERRSASVTRLAGGNPVQGDAAFAREVRENYSLVRAIASTVPELGVAIDFAREREIAEEVRVRSGGREFKGMPVPTEVFRTQAQPHEIRVVTSGAGSGAGIIPQQYLEGQYVDRLRNALVIGRLGATVLNDLRGNVAIPKNTSGNTAQWFPENTAITAGNKSFGQITMTPRHVGMITEYSRNLLLQSSPDIEMLLRQDFAAELAVAIDQAALSGNGDGNSPTGIMRTAGVATSSVQPSWANVAALIATIEANNRSVTGWAGAASAKQFMMTTPRQSSGVEGNFVMNDPNTLAGYPFYQTQMLNKDQVSPGTEILIGGYWPDLLVGYWSGLDLLTNPYESTAYAKGNVQVRGIISADVAVRHTESFAFYE